MAGVYYPYIVTFCENQTFVPCFGTVKQKSIGKGGCHMCFSERLREGFKMMMMICLLAAFCLLSWRLMVIWTKPASLAEVGQEKIEHEGKIAHVQTTCDYRYSAGFQKVMKNSKYKSFHAMYDPQFSSAIPGLGATDVLGTNCTGMVPQGLCFCEEYLLVSAYDCGLDGKRQRSVIYVMSDQDPKDRKCLTTLVLPDINHVGGLAYDGQYVWIAKSSTGTCSAIDKRAIDAAVMSRAGSCEVEYTTTVDCGVTASFLTYYDDRLWVGTFAYGNKKEGLLTSFAISGSGEELSLKRVNRLTIPCYANGVNIEKYNGKVYMSVVSSYSRVKDSFVYVYELENDRTEAISKKYCKRHRFPPMGEEVACDGSRLYFLFESAANCYSNSNGKNCSHPVDRICAIPMEAFYAGEDAQMGEMIAKKVSPETDLYVTNPLSDEVSEALDIVDAQSDAISKAAPRDTDTAAGSSPASFHRLLRLLPRWEHKDVT